MRDVTWLVLGTALVVTVPWACNGSEAGPGSSNGSGGGGTSTQASGSPSAGTGCDGCMVQCDAPSGSQSQGMCVDVGGPNSCNPISNEGCAANEVCDIGPGGFRCYGGGNTAKLCEGCDAAVQCDSGLTCSLGVCAKYCCDDSDCGTTGHCETIPDLAVGTCVTGGSSGPGPTSTGEQASSPASSSAATGGGQGGNGGAASASSSSSAASSSSSAASSSAAAGGAGGN